MASTSSSEKEHKLVAEGLARPDALETDVDSIDGSDPNEKLEELKLSVAGGDVTEGDAEKDVESGEKPAKEEIADPNIVWWDGPDDPQNPMNWPRWKRAGNVALISMLTFVAPLASCKYKSGFATERSDTNLPFSHVRARRAIAHEGIQFNLQHTGIFRCFSVRSRVRCRPLVPRSPL
jgi:hypothetical protein